MKSIVVFLVMLLFFSSAAQGCPYDFSNNEHYVKLNFKYLDTQFPIPMGHIVVSNQTVNITRVYSDGHSWLFTLLGVPPETSEDFVESEPNLKTDSYGSVVVSMLPSIKYKIEILNDSFYVYPVDYEYNIWIK